MNRLVGYSLRNGLRQQRISINQSRYLVTTQVGLARRRKNPKKEKEPDDHIEAFERRHKKAKADREKLAEKKVFERKKEKQKEKDQDSQANKIADMVTYLMAIAVTWDLYRFVNASKHLSEIEGYEKLDRVSSHDFFDLYLCKGKVKKIERAFQTEDHNCEYIIETVSGGQFVVVTNPESFGRKLLQIEKDLRIDPKERFSAQLPFAVKHTNAYIGTPQNTTDWKSAIYNDIMWSCVGLVILGGMFVRQGFGGTRVMHRNLSKQVMQQMNQQQQGQQAAKNIVKPIKDTNVLLKDVAGMKGEKIEIQEFINFLKEPKVYKDIGAKMPKGVLLHGPPGTGKTLLGKAVATECDVPFYYKTGSDFVKTYVGEGSKEIRNLFKVARQNTPCIIYIDEIDAMGKKRGAEMQGGGQERDVTLNQLLVEMDGLTTDEDIIIMAATNQPDSLDDALTRPGRLSRKIYCGLPDKEGRADIFNIYLKQVKTERRPGLYAESLAELTPGMSGAQIANVVNEAALRAARSGSDLVKQEHFDEAIERVNSGIKKETGQNIDERKILATIEAGKCLSSWLLETQDGVLKSSIVPRTHNKLGYTQFKQKERFLQSEEYLMDRIAVLQAGKISQKLLYGRIYAQVQGDADSDRATQLANDMVTVYGMGHLTGQRNFGKPKDQFEKPIYSGQTQRMIDMDRSKIIQDSSKIAEALLTEHKSNLERIIDILCDKEVITDDDLESILGPKATEGHLNE